MAPTHGHQLLFAVALALLTFGLDAFRLKHGRTVRSHLCWQLQSWPGNRPPVTNPARLEQCMDANWGRGRYRTEIWEGNVNPVDFWWEAYEPSAEEVEAADAGYDFSDPRKWHEVGKAELHGIMCKSLMWFHGLRTGPRNRLRRSRRENAQCCGGPL
jgi:hypothetical protein